MKLPLLYRFDQIYSANHIQVFAQDMDNIIIKHAYKLFNKKLSICS